MCGDEHVVRSDKLTALGERLAQPTINLVGRFFQREYVYRIQDVIDPLRELSRTPFSNTESELGRDDDTRADAFLADDLNPSGDRALRVPQQIGQDVGIEQVSTHQDLEIDFLRRWEIFIDVREFGFNRLQGLQ